MNSPESKPSVVVIGGGNGSSTVIESLLPYGLDLSAVVTVTDSGGSTGQLREQYPGLIGVGDIRQCIRALAGNREQASQLDKRSPDGHALGNLAIVEKSLKLGGVNHIEEAIDEIADELELRGKVIPVSLDNSHLHLAFPGGKEISGEINIATHNGNCVKKHLGELSLRPTATINPKAKDALLKADMNIIAPGNFYGSIIPPLLTDGVADAISESNAPFIMVSNIANGSNTPNFTLNDYIDELQRHTGLEPSIVIAHHDIVGDASYSRLITANLAASIEHPVDPADLIAHTRSRVRHCGQTLGSLLIRELRAT